jgi:hypothetical protein
MRVIIGNTGLVGKTLKETINFDLEFNSRNIQDYGTHDLNNSELWLSCLPATKWMVNKNIKSDIENINSILSHISKFKYSKIILISTIDVYCDSLTKSNELYPINFKSLSYGTNRYLFEKLVSQTIEFDNLYVFRLPALFNKNIKKNILFDLINDNNVSEINVNSSYQWYNLDDLSKDIDTFISQYPNEQVFNLFPEPIETSEIIKLFPKANDLINPNKERMEYNFTTKFNKSGYIKSKEIILNEIRKFVNESIGK